MPCSATTGLLLTSLVLPMLITPLLMARSKATIQRREKTRAPDDYRYAVNRAGGGIGPGTGARHARPHGFRFQDQPEAFPV